MTPRKASYDFFLALRKEFPNASLVQIADKLGVGRLQAVAWDARRRRFHQCRRESN